MINYRLYSKDKVILFATTYGLMQYINISSLEPVNLLIFVIQMCIDSLEKKPQNMQNIIKRIWFYVQRYKFIIWSSMTRPKANIRKNHNHANLIKWLWKKKKLLFLLNNFLRINEYYLLPTVNVIAKT